MRKVDKKVNNKTVVDDEKSDTYSNETGRMTYSETIRKIIPIREYDPVIVAATLLLILFGLGMVFSSSYYAVINFPKFQSGGLYNLLDKYNLSMYLFLVKQIMAIGLGVVAVILLAYIDYHIVVFFAPIFYLISVSFLLALQIPGIGIEYNGAVRWLEIFGIQFQPSEIAKLAIILMIAWYAGKKKDEFDTWRSFLVFTLIITVPAGIIFLDDFTTSLIVLAIGFGILFMTSKKIIRYIFMLLAAVGALNIYLEFFADPYRKARLLLQENPFADPMGKGFQTVQSLFAVGSGGFWGLGPGESRQKTILPECYSDFIFAIVCEELGVIGAGIILFLFAALIIQTLRVAMSSMDRQGFIIASGVAILFASQVVINVAVVTNVFPNTGIPLPFISAGGTSVVLNMATIGLLLNVSRFHKAE